MAKKGQDLGDPLAGVAFNPPPISIMAEASQVLNEMTAQLPPQANGAVIGIATQSGWNAAVMHRTDKTWTVGAWVGKHWNGGLTGGGAIRAVW
jgi:hypothetical protein